MHLLSNSVFLLIFISITGYGLGKIKTVSFDSSAVIFIAIIFGYFGFLLPKDFQTLGLVLFIYSIGIQAGPGFLSSFRKNGLTLSIGAAVIVVCGFVSSLFCAWIFGFNESICAGLFTGALTSTPGLAATTSISHTPYASTAYATVYPIALLGMILCTKLIVCIL